MQRVVDKLWRVRAHDPARVAALAAAVGTTELVARLLANRGVAEAEEARQFLGANLGSMHDPLLMKGMAEAVERLAAAVTGNEPVCIHGDYDVDGVTATALLVSFLRAVAAPVMYYIPRRLDEGYGISRAGVEAVAGRGARVMVSVDCGITAVAEADRCRELGLDLIITDHHMPGETLPAALAVVNPLQPGCPFPFKALAGVGIAFNLLVALRAELRRRGHFVTRQEPDLREYLDLVALGTVADVVPLKDENRVFVRYGLRELTRGARPGVRALKQVAGVDGEVSCGAVGFRLAPRLNAAGRLEDAAPGVELLLTGDGELATSLAQELDAGNAERQAVEQEILRDALAQLKATPGMAEARSIVLASDRWHPGVIGIVASRLVDLFHRPTILIALQEGNGRGSGRSIPAFHLHDALHACSDHLTKFGGHKYAAGLSIAEETLEAFVASFNEVAAGQLSPEDLMPELALDCELPPAAITADLVTAVESLAPFGMGNPEPVFLLAGAEVVDCRILKEKHLKLKVRAGGQSFEAVGFNLAEKRPAGRTVDLAFTPQISEWNGRRSLQLKLKDIREAAGA